MPLSRNIFSSSCNLARCGSMSTRFNTMNRVTLRFSSYWRMQVPGLKSSGRDDGLKVNYDSATHEVSGVMTRGTAEDLESKPPQGHVTLTRFTESKMWPGPQVEEVWVAENATFTNCSMKRLKKEIEDIPEEEFMKTDKQLAEEKKKKEKEEEEMSEEELRERREAERKKKVDFSSTLTSDNIFLQQGMPRRGG